MKFDDFYATEVLRITQNEIEIMLKQLKKINRNY